MPAWKIEVDVSASKFFDYVGTTTYAYYRVLMTEVLPHRALPAEFVSRTLVMSDRQHHKFYFIKARVDEPLLKLLDWLNEAEVKHIFSRSAMFMWERPGVRTILGGVVPDGQGARDEAMNRARPQVEAATGAYVVGYLDEA